MLLLGVMNMLATGVGGVWVGEVIKMLMNTFL